MHNRKIAALAAAALLFLGTASCGNDSDDGASTDPTTTTAEGGSSTDAPGTSGGPSEEEIATAIVTGLNQSQERADCAASKVATSDLPQGSLQAIANNDPGSISDSDMGEVRQVLNEALAGCP